MADGNYFYRLRFVINHVQQPVVADADAVAIAALQLFHPRRARIVFQFEEFLRNAVVDVLL